VSERAPATRPAANRQAGFTLIELIATLTILGFIMAGLTAGVRVLTSGWERNAERLNQVDMLARAGDLIRRDVEGVQRYSALFQGEPYYLFKGEKDEMSFVVVEPPYPTKPGLYYIDYALKPAPGGTALVRSRAPFSKEMREFPGATPANIVPLIEGPLAFRFTYAIKSEAGWDWQDAWPYPARLPDLIRIEIVNAKSGDPFAPPFLLAVKADAELDCISDVPRYCSAKSDGELKKLQGGANRFLRTIRNDRS
jgi:general secretion pathway protein J